MKESTKNNRAKKAERRKQKAARKAANAQKDKKSKPNNLILTLVIVLILGGIFGGVLGYNYLQKPATIEKYIENNSDEYEDIDLDDYTKVSFSAEKNSLTLTFDINTDDEEAIKDYTDYYTGDDGSQLALYYAVAYLTDIKPNTRAISADTTIKINLNEEEIYSDSISYKEAQEILENGFTDEDESTDADTDVDDSADAELEVDVED